MTESDKLNQILATHYELQALSENDADIYAWFQQCHKGRCTVEEALIGALVHVAKGKKKLFDELVKKEIESPTPKIFNPIEE